VAACNEGPEDRSMSVGTSIKAENSQMKKMKHALFLRLT
jgi:hypothetical protein